MITSKICYVCSCICICMTYASYKMSRPRDKANNVVVHPAKDSDQPGHPPSLIRVFAVRMTKASVLSYPFSVQRRLWSDWVDAQADLRLRLAHSHFVGFVTRRLINIYFYVPHISMHCMDWVNKMLFCSVLNCDGHLIWLSDYGIAILCKL